MYGKSDKRKHLAIGSNIDSNIHCSHIFHFSFDTVNDVLFYKGLVGLFDHFVYEELHNFRVIVGAPPNRTSLMTSRKLDSSTTASADDAQAMLFSRS